MKWKARHYRGERECIPCHLIDKCWSESRYCIGMKDKYIKKEWAISNDFYIINAEITELKKRRF